MADINLKRVVIISLTTINILSIDIGLYFCDKLHKCLFKNQTESTRTAENNSLIPWRARNTTNFTGSNMQLTKNNWL